jgi:hypothetical protein
VSRGGLKNQCTGSMFTRMSIAWGFSRSRGRAGHDPGDRQDSNHGEQNTTPRDNVGPALGGLMRNYTHVRSLPMRRDAAESTANRVARCQRFCEVDPTAFISIRTR